jgi:hypothetical protein
MDDRRVPWSREPLVHFFLAGVVLFALAWIFEVPRDAARLIVVDDVVRRELLTTFLDDRGRAPREEEIVALVESWVEGEILHREGLELGLDRQDRKVRNLVIDRMRQLVEGMAYVEEPDEAALRSYFETHRERYGEPARFDLRHVFVGGDAAQGRAAALLRRLQAGEDPAALGDPFAGGNRLWRRTTESLTGIFGEAFVDGLAEAPPGEWHLRAGRQGWHVVVVERFDPAVKPEFAAVREEVLADVRSGRRTRAVEAELRALRERYEVRNE